MEYVTSDWHIGHHGIVTHCRTQFKDEQEMRELIVKNHNQIVYPNDVVYVLGDISIGMSDIEFSDFLKSLNGEFILIMGNHDKLSPIRYFNMGFREVYNHPIFYNKKIIMSHEPIPVSDHFINLHGHLHNAYLDSKNHINVNCELWDFKPVKIKRFIDRTYELPKIKARFLEEWYKDQYVFLKDRADVLTDENGRIRYKETMAMKKK